MSITVTGDNKHDIMNKLDIAMPRADIRILFRRRDAYNDYRPHNDPGCIVDATIVPGQRVQRDFPKSADAVRYIAAMLKVHDDSVAKAMAENAQRLKHEARLARATAKKKCCTTR